MKNDDVLKEIVRINQLHSKEPQGSSLTQLKRTSTFQTKSWRAVLNIPPKFELCFESLWSFNGIEQERKKDELDNQ